MAHRYGLATRGATGNVSVAQFDLTPQNNVRVKVYEFALYTTTNTVGQYGLAVLTSGIGTGSAGQAPAQLDTADPSPKMRYHTTWTVQPTAPSNWLLLFNFPAVSGGAQGAAWRWAENAPLIIPMNGSLLLWNLATSSVCDIYMEVEE